MASRYPEIKQYILQQIDNNVFVEGIMLPPEKDFTELFKVSRMTVRRAFDELIQDGVLYRKKGSGVFLAKQKIKRSVEKVSTQKDEEIRSQFGNVSIKVIDFKIVHNHFIVNKYLGLENEDAYQVKRVQIGDDQPIVYENLFLPCRYFTNFTKEDCETSLTNLTQIHFLHNDKKIKNQITVEAASATKTLSSLLHITVNDPVLQLTIIAGDEEGHKYYCGINSYPGDTFSYSTE